VASRVTRSERYSGSDGLRQPRRAAFGLAAVLALLALPACSITAPFTRSGDGELVTGSIQPRRAEPAATPAFLDERLDPEDVRRARAALATALDPQGSGASVKWDNPDSGAKGAIAAVGGPYLQKDDICRNFIASVSLKSPDAWQQGIACRLAAGEWTIRELKPWKQPG
jgi:17 kDa outer membrane surface antigen